VQYQQAAAFGQLGEGLELGDLDDGQAGPGGDRLPKASSGP